MNLKAKCLLLSCFILALVFLLCFRQFEVVFPVEKKTLRRLEQQQEERFMTYLPHSGTHNQRVSLINAMVIAKILNRTLLMPEMNIGKAVSWRNSAHLSQQLEVCPSTLMQHEKNAEYEAIRAECERYRHYVPVPVQSVFDLTTAHERFGVRTEERKTMQRDYWKQHYLSRLSVKTTETDAAAASLEDITPSLVYVINDPTRYTYQLYEGALNNIKQDSKYSSYISLESLKDRPELYMEFGSLFGGSRIALLDLDLIKMREDLHQETRLKHPIMDDISQEISYLLGNNYTSLHLRQGDGGFKTAVSQTIRNLGTALQQHLDAQRQQMSNIMTKEEEYLVIQSLFYQQQKTRNVMHRLETCLSIQNYNILDLEIIYLATDAKNSREQFKELYDQYPCLFALNDFPEVIAEAKQKKTNATDIAMDLLIPMIDAEIASRGKYFIGTPGSTFSGYIRSRNNYYNLF